MTRRDRVRAWAPWLVRLLVAGACIAAASQASAQQMAFEEVVANLKVGDPKVRMDALKLLREAGYLEAAPAIAPLLSDPVPEIQALALETEVALFLVDEAYSRAFGKDLVKAAGATLPLYAFAQGPGATIPNTAPASVIRGIVLAAASPIVHTRFDAVYALGVLAPPLIARGTFVDAKAATDRLMVIIREPDATMRLAATHVLGRLIGAALKNPAKNADLMAVRGEVGDQVVAGMNDSDEMIRLSSMGALGEMRHDRAAQSLTDAVGYYKRSTEGMAALDALAHIGHPGSATVFVALLESSDQQVRRLAVEGLARTRDRNALASMFIRTTSDKSEVVQHAVAFARAKNGDFTQMTRLVEGFSRSGLQAFAFDDLVELGSPIAASLVGFASHKDAKVRAGVAEVLGITGSESSLVVLQTLSRDKDKLVAAAADRSRKRLLPREATQPRVP
ncbi:MAG: HEAT repeat domain-containing protein [Acidobacteria bacterium]|nr:HEAT repeat domain-containing protein [Acidobacteriota bacterium]